MIAIFIDERGRSVQPKGPQRRDRHRHLISKAACHLNSARWLRLERPSSCRVGIPVWREIDAARLRSEERRGGKGCVSTCRSGWETDHEKTKNNANRSIV